MTVVDATGRKFDSAALLIEEHKRDFQLCFGSPAGQRVLAHLAPFCRAEETCIVRGDRDMTLVLEGRREVWLRIQQYLNLSPQQLLRLYPAAPLEGDKAT